MDRMIYVAMTGARESLRSQTGASHNVANVSTIGFRAIQERLGSAPVAGPGLPTRVNSVGVPAGINSRNGEIQQTGRNLDLAIQGKGWLAVQDDTGRELYTRAGNLRINANGMLETAAGYAVAGSGGPVTIPPNEQLYIGDEGQVSVVGLGQPAQALAEVARLKLVSPDETRLTPRGDGVYALPEGEGAAPDPTIRVASGQLESSNVNVTEALVQMIELGRHYELQVRAMNAAESADTTAARLLRING
jgi:flagellar basal-body rod protein FlgF